jgi:hypothetical protein
LLVLNEPLAAELGLDAAWLRGVEVQEPPAPFDCADLVPGAGQQHLGRPVVGSRAQRRHTGTVGQPQRAAVRIVTPLLHPRHTGSHQVPEEACW